MAQHYLLSAEARSVSLRAVFGMTDAEAETFFAQMRWGEADEQVCPHCNTQAAHRRISAQRRWRCRDCDKAFSVTSGTLFHNHKLSLQLLLAAVVLYVNAAKGISALQMSRDLDVQYKTAFVLLHKLRECLFKTRDKTPLQGEVEIDGCYVHKYVRPPNNKRNRRDYRSAKYQNPLKCVILVLRERSMKAKQGARRTRTFVIQSENDRDAWAIVRQNVAPGAVIYSDEAHAYNVLDKGWEHYAVNHSEQYSAPDGVNENQAESFFSRFRRMVWGQIHHHSRRYLEVYAHEMAEREDRRRAPNGSFLQDLLKGCLQLEPSRYLCKYWQGNHRTHDSVRSYV